MSDACEVPFVEQLRSVPSRFRASREIQWAEDGTPTGHQFIPVGVMFHRAADTIAKLEADLATLRAENAQLENDCNMLTLDRQELQERLAGYEGAPVVVWQWRRKSDQWGLDKTFNSEVFVTSDDTERRALIVKPAKEGTKT